jgi:hypothetical protein
LKELVTAYAFAVNYWAKVNKVGHVSSIEGGGLFAEALLKYVYEVNKIIFCLQGFGLKQIVSPSTASS